MRNVLIQKGELVGCRGARPFLHLAPASSSYPAEASLFSGKRQVAVTV